MKNLSLSSVFFFLFWLQFVAVDAEKLDEKVMFVVKSSSSSIHQTELVISSKEFTQTLFNPRTIKKVLELPVMNNYFLLEDGAMVRVYVMDDSGVFYDVLRKEVVTFSPEVSKKIQDFFFVLQQKHFGELVEWDEMQHQIPKYAEFKITDLETGLKFRAQRRAGSNHADVQPLTKEDTAIMKKIYNGKWSWNRRAILVHVNGKRIAASMHGMPHGGGALANDFPGHFCIHFRGSTTHTSKKLDLSHQAMIHVAGGKLLPYVSQLDGEDLGKLFFVSLQQNDLDLLQAIYNDDAIPFDSKVMKVENVRIIDEEEIINDTFVYKTKIKYKVKLEGKDEVVDVISLGMTRDSLTSAWRINSIESEMWNEDW
ncbi:hypothetical protein ACERII_25140 [Evansella sp. AB-rgal1]|uniref:hypothetical protein n=1 Tax=Evansella sp. AB-rgal1 TaxID=3242696 RepID=UPI00359D74E2